jgi:EAL domain-containing protein (putative c-di-GMP-specific phosphodiesterase class I)
VESLEELAFLRAYRCEEAQGYYFSRPVLPQQFALLLREGIPKSAVVDHWSPAIAAAGA